MGGGGGGGKREGLCKKSGRLFLSLPFHSAQIPLLTQGGGGKRRRWREHGIFFLPPPPKNFSLQLCISSCHYALK